MKGQTKKLTVSALLLAADVILTRILAFNTPLMKIGLGFAATALCAMLYGPWWAAGIAALGDLLGSLLFPTGAYFRLYADGGLHGRDLRPVSVPARFRLAFSDPGGGAQLRADLIPCQQRYDRLHHWHALYRAARRARGAADRDAAAAKSGAAVADAVKADPPHPGRRADHGKTNRRLNDTGRCFAQRPGQAV